MTKKFTKQFREEAVNLVKQSGRPVAEVAKQLGIGYSTLDKWIRLSAAAKGETRELTAEQKENRELKKRIAHLEEVNEVLKKATAFFANHPNR